MGGTGESSPTARLEDRTVELGRKPSDVPAKRKKEEFVKYKNLTPELKTALRDALRDSADWHPRLHAAVAAITGMETSHCVRSRVYCTSASTMYSLLNILKHGQDR